jgi:hypothetical protein
MPHLLTLLPCEKVLTGERQTVSLITILSEFHFVLREPDALKGAPPNAAIPFNWAIFMQWERQPDDPNGQFEFEQSLTIVSDAGVTPFKHVAKFVFENVAIQRYVGAFDIIPILPAGRYEISLEWRRDPSSSWIEAGRYPVRVAYDPAPVSPAPVTATSD